MAMIISFINQKGGVGKTTASLCTAFELSKRNTVLMVDADPQSTIDNWLEVRNKPLPENLSIESVCKKYKNRDSSKKHTWDMSKFLGIFIEVLKDGYDHFDYIVVDTPPRLSDITRASIGVSDLAVIPCQPSGCDAWATQETLKIVRDRPNINGDLKVMLVINRKFANSLLSVSIRDFIADLGNDFYLAKSEITNRAVYAKSLSLGLSVQEADREKKASKEITKFVSELLKFGGSN
jgi:chromosome partitioning protein